MTGPITKSSSTPQIKILLGVLAFSLLFPVSAIRESRVHFMHSYLKIQTGKSNPPRIAFFEAIADSLESKNAEVAAPAIEVIHLSEVIAEKQLRPALQSIRYRRVDIQPMAIARNEALLNLGLQKSQNLASTSAAAMGRENSDESWQETLTPKEKQILQSSNLSQKDLDFSNIEDPREKAMSEKIQQEIRNVKSTVPSGWVISGSGAPANAPMGESAKDLDATGEKSIANKVHGFNAFQVQGHLGLDASTPYLPGYHFEIHWLREGISRATGQIFPEQDWRYSIDIPELIGSVQVDLYDGYGSLMAYGSLRLSPEQQSSEIKNALIQLQPARKVTGVNRDFVRSFGDSKAKFKAAARTKVAVDEETEFVPDQDGRLTIDGVSPRSTMFAYTEAEGFYPAIHVLQAGKTQNMTLMPQKTIEALREIVDQQRIMSRDIEPNGAVIWGQVRAQGKPVAGLRVEVQEFSEELKPVYLNSLLIPDPTLQATSENGFFVFLDLPAGYYSLRAYHGPQFYGFGNVLNEPGAVAYANIDGIAHRAPFEVRAFDAFTSEEQIGNIHLQNLGDQAITIAGYGILDAPVAQQTSLAWFEPSDPDYLNAIYTYRGDADHIHTPLVRKSWMENLKQQAVISQQPDTGTFVGFVSEGNYQISLPHLEKQTPLNVVFFDSSGTIAAGPTPNGGFVIFNIPVGGETVVIHQANGETQSQIIPIDANQTTIVRFQP